MRLLALTSSLQAKVFGVIFALTFVLVAFLSTYFSARHIASERRGLESRALAYAHLLAEETESAVAFDDRETAREVFAAMSEDADVRALALYKAGGQLLQASGEASHMPAPEDIGLAPHLVALQGAIVAVAPVVSREGPRGVIVLELSTASLDLERARILNTSAFVGACVLVLGGLAAFGIGRSLARRLRVIAQATGAIAAGNLEHAPIVDASRDEVGQLARASNQMLENLRGLVAHIRDTAEKEQVRLDELVQQRTAELDARNKDLRLVLDHVAEGLFMVDAAGAIAKEHSLATEAWLGAPRPGDAVWSYVARTDPTAGRWLELAWPGLEEDILPLEAVLEQFPKRMRAGDLELELDYKPILDGDRVVTLLVVVSDVTSELARARSEEAQREMLSVFERVTKDRAGFLEFYGDAKQMLARILAAPPQMTTAVFRDVHTLKGNCAAYGLTSVASMCHALEARMLEAREAPSVLERQALARLWREVCAKIAGLLGEVAGDRLELPERERTAHLEAILNGTPRRELARTVAEWKHEATAERLARVAHQIEATARRLGKSVLVRTEPNDLRLDRASWATFWGSFVHVVRNAVDHGVEPEDSRREVGKSAQGTISLRTAREGGEWVVQIADDGPGIDWAALATKGEGLGMATATRADLVEVLFRDGVSTRTAATELSGRGVGMGAVRAECEARGGTVSVESEPGRGTAFSFRFPAATMGATLDLPRDLRSINPAA
jgi:HPt (histidine-containing phosphotransfer) domain-containing protein/HAMP domain-containing protein